MSSVKLIKTIHDINNNTTYQFNIKEANKNGLEKWSMELKLDTLKVNNYNRKSRMHDVAIEINIFESLSDVILLRWMEEYKFCNVLRDLIGTS